MLECRDEFEMYNYYQIQLSNDDFIKRIAPIPENNGSAD